MRLIGLLALLLLAATPAAAQTGQAAPSTDDFVTTIVRTAWTDPAKCNLGNARRMSLAEARRRFDADFGKCIAVPAYADYGMLFATLGDRARALSSKEDVPRFGFYARDTVVRRAARRPLRRYWVVGRLSDCERAWPAEWDRRGYCHAPPRPAPILIVAEIRATAKP